MKFCINRFRVEFGASMVKVRENMSELDQAASELRRKVSDFCK